MIIEENTCECGCTRQAHVNGKWECRYCGGGRCSTFRPQLREVPDIFEEDDDAD